MLSAWKLYYLNEGEVLRKDILTMSSLSNLEFTALGISGKNDLSWVLDAEIHLNLMGFGDIIKEETLHP